MKGGRSLLLISFTPSLPPSLHPSLLPPLPPSLPHSLSHHGQPQSGGTAIPRIRERLPTGIEISRAASQINKTPVGNTLTPSLPSSRTTPSLVRAQARVEAELEILKDGCVCGGVCVCVWVSVCVCVWLCV